ncbi:MAG: glycosyltransferase, partial [Terracidiphilus sp.]
MDSLRTLKVLVSVFAFSPIKGSEFAMGWDYVRAIAEDHRVWVIARTNEREETEQFLRDHPDAMPNVTIHYVPWSKSSFAYPLCEIPYYFMFRNWQWRAYRRAVELDKQIGFDIVHQAIPSGFREPGFLWKIDKPFVWGPVGGLQYFPLRLLSAVPLRSRAFFVVKNITTFWAMHGSRRPRIAAAKASAIIAGTALAAKRINALWGKDAQVLCEVSAPVLSPVAPPARRRPGEAFRIVWSGRFEPRKALNIVLLALHRLRESNFDWELTCLGTGPLLQAWQALARELGIANRCRFLGQIPRKEAIAVMASGHCFVQPSLYDATTSVVVEALAMGLPVVCLDHFGFRDVVDESCGIRIKP